VNKIDVLRPIDRYWGKFTPANLAFNANLQEFSHQVSLIVALETGGKLSPIAAYEQIEALRTILSRSKQQLGIEGDGRWELRDGR
jgi:hypothetical protein